MLDIDTSKFSGGDLSNEEDYSSSGCSDNGGTGDDCMNELWIYEAQGDDEIVAEEVA